MMVVVVMMVPKVREMVRVLVAEVASLVTGSTRAKVLVQPSALLGAPAHACKSACFEGIFTLEDLSGSRYELRSRDAGVLVMVVVMVVTLHMSVVSQKVAQSVT